MILIENKNLLWYALGDLIYECLRYPKREEEILFSVNTHCVHSNQKHGDTYCVHSN
jgi:hypothetical protein